MVVCYRLIIKRVSRQFELSDSYKPRINNQDNVENGDKPRNLRRQNATNDNTNAISHTDNNNISYLAKHKRRVKIVKNRKLAHRLFILIVVFCGCMLPTFLVGVVTVALQISKYCHLPWEFKFFERDSLYIKHFRIWSAIGGTLNSFANPFIYTFTYPKFKAELRKMFPLFAKTNNKVGIE